MADLVSGYFADLVRVLKGDFIALDETDAAMIGAPKGETVSLFCAIQQRHGSALAHVACAVFSVLIQSHHCSCQLDGTPMRAGNYVRAAGCLLVPVMLALWVIGWVT